MRTRDDDGWSVELVVGVVALVVALVALVVALTREPGTSTRSTALGSATQPSLTSTIAATMTTSAATPTTTAPATVGPTVPPATTPSTARSGHCDISATWTPRDSHGATTLLLRVSSNEPQAAMGTEIRDNPNKRGLMDAGFTDRNGLWGKDFVFAAGARPVNIYVHFASPLFAECTLLTRAPA